MAKAFARVFKYGDNIDTDVIIPTRFLNTGDPAQLGKNCFADYDPAFVRDVRPGDIIVAGENFGCGSSREQAPVAIKANGVAMVVAKSFARIFFRNAVNLGLTIVESKTAADIFDYGDTVEVDMAAGKLTRADGAAAAFTPVGEAMREIIAAGGLINYINSKRAR